MTQDAAPGFSWITAYRRVRWWLVVCAAWTLFGALVAAHFQWRDGDARFADAFGIVSYYWAWIPLTPLLVELTRRFDGTAVPWPRSALVLALGGVGAILLHVALYSAGFAVFTGPVSVMPLVFTKTILRHGIGDAAMYGGLVAVLVALRQRERALLRERDAAASALRASRLEAQLSEARLAALRMQLQPHFLFNALNTVSALVLKGDAEAAIRAVRQLADLLRVTLHGGDAPELPLREETEFVLRYLELEQLRFGERLRVACAIDPALDDALVPSLILQPLVENAVLHGLRARAAGGQVRLSAVREGDTLRLEVTDDGVGLPADGHGAGGVGLANTRARLAERYGDAARLTVRPAPAGGTIAAIVLPYRTAPAETAVS